jgi:hypothetical protein
MPLNQATMLAKAKSIFEARRSKDGDTSINETFTVSKDWFDCFQKKACWHNIRVQGETTSADTEAAKDFPQQL